MNSFVFLWQDFFACRENFKRTVDKYVKMKRGSHE